MVQLYALAAIAVVRERLNAMEIVHAATAPRST
jgi:hypothetical protein